MLLLGNLATLLVVVAMLFAYRYFDLRSRSLAKTKRYADRIAGRLAATIEQNTSAIHDQAIELQVNLKTGKELLKRIRDVEDHLDARTAEARQCGERIAGQMQTVDALTKRTGEVAVEVRRIMAECSATAAVGERLGELSGACSRLEQRIDRISASVDSVGGKIGEVMAGRSELPALQQQLAHVEQMSAEVRRRVTELRNQSRHVDALQDSLGTMEQSVARLQPGVAEVADTVAELQRQVEVVSSGSARAQQAIEALATIDTLLEEIEGRADRLQVAREWLARTETRLAEISDGAQDQLRLLETVLKAERGNAADEESSAAMGTRAMVVKLAGQGWSVPEISRATRLSLGEVELTLEVSTAGGKSDRGNGAAKQS